MPLGPGRYDKICTAAREACAARGAILIVTEGFAGSGFSVQGDIDLLKKLPSLLRQVALEIEASLREETQT